MTSFLLNGAPRHITPPPGRTVLDVLRLEARLTGTKEGCAEGDCGACTIALARPAGEGLAFAAVNSCIMLASDLDGCLVLTAEGLAHDGALAPVQTALIDSHGSQCGFCTPGFVMSLFVTGQSPATSEQILDAISGNLCRCTGYRPILDAAKTLPGTPDPRIPAWRAALDALHPTGDAPQTLEALDRCLAAHPHSKLTAGTTDLGVGIAKHGIIPPHMVSLRAIPELKTITATPTHLEIGATATYSEILTYLDDRFPSFAALIRRLGSVQIRNLGTMGGNICNASPIGDSAPCLIALDATLILRSAAGERELPVEDFFTAYRKTALRPTEYLKTIRIPYLSSNTTFHAYKLARRFDQDISTVAAGFSITLQNNTITAARIAFGGMAATPIRASTLDSALAHQPCAHSTFAHAATLVPGIFHPISDFRASAAYRLEAAAGFLIRLAAELHAEPADIWAL